MNRDNWQRIQALFHEAMDTPASARAALLDDRCAGDEELRRAVESLLDHVDQDSGFEAVVQQAAGSLLNEGKDMAGQRIGPYRVLSKLGQGGMGSVYLAERADDQYRQQVAIKLMRAGSVSDELMQRFRVERQILAKLEHPYIARLLDGGATEQGSPYLVMEYIEGEPIDLYCNRNQLGVRDRLLLFQKVCSAVQYAHQKLVVHRDLKPSNLMVTGEGQPKLLDFGIAKLLDREDPGQTIVETRVDTRLLTPRYASPEQIRGDPVTTVTDVYVLGLILYELLTGNQPYGEVDTGRFSMERAVLETVPTRPSLAVLQPPAAVAGDGDADTAVRFGQVQPRQLKRQLAGDLDNIVMMALRKEPERRYYSVAQLADDIGRYLEQRPVIARPATWSYRSSRYLSRHRYSSALAALLMVSVVGFGVATWKQSKVVALERDIARQEGAKAEAVSGFLSNMFSAIHPDKAQGKEVTVREMLDKASQQLEAEDHKLAGQPAVEAVVHRVIGSIYSTLGILPPAESHLEQGLRLHQADPHDDPEEYLHTIMALGGLYHQQFREEQRLPLSVQALELSEQVYGAEHRHTLGAMNNLASNYLMLGKLQEAEALYLEVYEKRKAVLGEDDADIPKSLVSLGTVHYWMGDFDQAIYYYRLCYKDTGRLLGVDHTQTLECLASLGSVLETAGEYAAAEPVLLEHVERAGRILGENHPDTLRSMHNLADTYRGLGRYVESEELFRKTLERRRQVLGKNHIETLQTRMKLARVLRLAGRYTEAEEHIVPVVEEQRRALGFEHPTTLIAAQQLAELYLAREQWDEALDLLSSVLRGREQVLGDDHPELHDTLAGLARACLAKGKHAEAEVYLQRALELADDNPDFKAQDIPGLLRMLIQLYETIGFPERAEPYRERLVRLENA